MKRKSTHHATPLHPAPPALPLLSSPAVYSMPANLHAAHQHSSLLLPFPPSLLWPYCFFFFFFFLLLLFIFFSFFLILIPSRLCTRYVNKVVWTELVHLCSSIQVLWPGNQERCFINLEQRKESVAFVTSEHEFMGHCAENKWRRRVYNCFMLQGEWKGELCNCLNQP